jgi:hypothetical protein
MANGHRGEIEAEIGCVRRRLLLAVGHPELQEVGKSDLKARGV